MFLLLLAMLLILVLAAAVVVYVAFPHRDQEVPGAPWLGEAMKRGVEHGRLLHLRIRNQNSVIVNLPVTLERNEEITLVVAYSGRIEPQDVEDEGVQSGNRGADEPSICTRCPIGFSLGQYRRAAASLMIATSGLDR